MSDFTQLYHQLRATYGPQPHWWPATEPFEIAIGAILTQNTRWQNVEKALHNLKQAQLLSCSSLLACPPTTLAKLIKPAGYYNQKAARLHNLCCYLTEAGGLNALANMPRSTTRSTLLAVKGIGPETADDILLYALQQPVFIIDLYTRRLFSRYGLIQGNEPYDAIRITVEQAIPSEVALYQEYHALIVQHAQQACRKRPLCTACAMQPHCAQRS
jgi:endonuclease-3 related protein